MKPEVIIFLCWMFAAWMSGWLISGRLSVYLHRDEAYRIMTGERIPPDRCYRMNAALGLMGVGFILSLLAMAFAVSP